MFLPHLVASSSIPFEIQRGAVGLVAAGAFAFALWYTLRRGLERRRLVLDVAALLVCGPALGALAWWLIFLTAPPHMGGPASGRIMWVLVAIPVTVLVSLAGACAGLGLAEKVQTGRGLSTRGYLGALGGFLLGSLLAAGEFVAIYEINTTLQRLGAFVLAPLTIGAMGVMGFFLVDVAPPPKGPGHRLRSPP